MLLLACAGPAMKQHIVNPDAVFDLLVASDHTAFKQTIHDRLIERYRDQCNIDIVSVSQIEALKSENYDAIIIMDSTMAWSGFNFSVKQYLNTSIPKERVILVMTADDPDWQFNYNGVDAITSASAIENEEKLFTLITMQIDHILTSTKNK